MRNRPVRASTPRGQAKEIARQLAKDAEDKAVMKQMHAERRAAARARREGQS